MKIMDEKLLAALARIEQFQSSTPKLPAIHHIIDKNDWSSQIRTLGKQVNKIIEKQQPFATSLTTQLPEIAAQVQKFHHPEVSSILSITNKLYPFISKQAQFASNISQIAAEIVPVLEATRTINSFNAFQIYKETYDEFGGDLDPENFTEEDVTKTIEENQELITEVNQIILQAEKDDISPENTSDLIYSYLLKILPTLSKKTYIIVVLIILTIKLSFDYYSMYSSSKLIEEEVIPQIDNISNTVEENSSSLENIEKEITVNKQEIIEANEKLDSATSVLNELNTDLEEFKDDTKDKLDLLIEEMKKLNSEQEGEKE